MVYLPSKSVITPSVVPTTTTAAPINGLFSASVTVPGMEALRSRYLDNGMLDFLLKEREAGRIRNLGFSYHGDIEVFDYLLSRHDELKWDFVQIQLNYVDWRHAKEVAPASSKVPI